MTDAAWAGVAETAPMPANSAIAVSTAKNFGLIPMA